MSQYCYYCNNALLCSNFEKLCELVNIEDYGELLGESLKQEESYYCDEPKFSSKGLPHLEQNLEIKYASLFEEYRKLVNDDPEYSCCSCLLGLM